MTASSPRPAGSERDERDPKPCPVCGQTCTYDGWDHVHGNGLGIGSCQTTPAYGHWHAAKFYPRCRCGVAGPNPATRDTTGGELREALRTSIRSSSWTCGITMLDSDVAAFADHILALPALRDPLAERDTLAEVAEERARQDAKWGEQNHPDVDQVLMNRPGGCSPLRMAQEYEIPSAGRAKFITDTAASRGEATWAAIAVEELAEAVEAAALGDELAVRTEVVQLAAVCVQWVQAIDRRALGTPTTGGGE